MPDLIESHTRHKLLLLAHGRERYQALGRLMAQAKAYPIGELTRRYGTEFMSALKIKSTVRKHVNVLHHIVGYFSSQLDKAHRRELHDVIEVELDEDTRLQNVGHRYGNFPDKKEYHKFPT